MEIIGIDFSIKFPSACITEDFKKFKFVSLVNTLNISGIHKKFLIDTEKNLSDFNVEFLDGVVLKKDNAYHLNERLKLTNYRLFTEHFKNMIKVHLKEKDTNDTESPILAIEGTSYNSKGNHAFELPAASMLFKSKAFENILDEKIDNYFVFPPANLKQAIGCKGNAKKDIIFHQFLKDPGIDFVKQTEFYLFLKEIINNPRVFNSKRSIVDSPWNDLIDAYLAVLNLYKIINS